MEKTLEVKSMIIENFIDYCRFDEKETKRLKSMIPTYLDEDHVDEIMQAFEILGDEYSVTVRGDRPYSDDIMFDYCVIASDNEQAKLKAISMFKNEFGDMRIISACIN